MYIRITLTGAAAALMLSGCASKTASDDSSQAFSGPTLVHISHQLTRADDGSRIFLTVDGKDAGLLPSGESRDIHLKAGKHQVGGYVSTLFNYGRVTVKPVDVTTNTSAIQNITYAVTNNQSGFRVSGSTPVPPPAPVVASPPATPSSAPAAEGQSSAQNSQASAESASATSAASASSDNASASTSTVVTESSSVPAESSSVSSSAGSQSASVSQQDTAASSAN